MVVNNVTINLNRGGNGPPLQPVSAGNSLAFLPHLLLQEMRIPNPQKSPPSKFI
jgi:hypothetical protein